MATNGKMNATKVKALLNDGVFVHCLNVSLRLSAQRVPKTTKDSEGYLSQRPGTKSGTVTLRGYLDYSVSGGSDRNLNFLESIRNDRQTRLLRVNFGGTTGDKYLLANARMTGYRVTGGTEANLEVEATFQLTGAIQWLTQ